MPPKSSSYSNRSPPAEVEVAIDLSVLCSFSLDQWLLLDARTHLSLSLHWSRDAVDVDIANLLP
jgi:hypothetical protein